MAQKLITATQLFVQGASDVISSYGCSIVDDLTHEAPEGTEPS